MPIFSIESLESRTLLSGLTIVPTFAANIRHDPSAAKIEAAVNAGIARIDSLFLNSITVPVLFQEGGGLGSNSAGFNNIPYAQWRTAMVSHASDTNQRLAAASLPATNTVNGSDTVQINYADELALGIPDTFPSSFATVYLNIASCNLTRTSINPNKYDLQDVAMHELDEVLGIGSVLDEVTRNGQPIPTDDIDPEDFFRYSGGPNGSRDFTTDANASVYFSIDGGKTDLAQFNQDAGGDFNDWYSINGNQIPQVQDAFGTPGVIANYNVEPVVLDALGFTPARTLGTGLVTGSVFNDTNGDGIQDGTDADVSGWTVEALQGAKVIATTQSNALQYQIGSLPDGTYTIKALPQLGYIQTTPVAAFTVTLTGQNDTVSSMNFGESPIPVGPISGTVFKDVSGNGTLDGSQLPLAGVKIALHEDTNGNGQLDAKDKLIETITTASDGTYSFTGLLAGEYFVTQTVPRGFVRTAPALTNTYSLKLAAGQTALDQNFENFQKLPPAGLTHVSYSVNSKTVKKLHGHVVPGSTISVTFTVTRPAGEQLSLVSYTTPSAVVPAAIAHLDVVFDSSSQFYMPGTYTLTITAPTTRFFQVDFVLEDAITQFGPAGSSIFYTSQSRLIAQG